MAEQRCIPLVFDEAIVCKPTFAVGGTTEVGTADSDALQGCGETDAQ
jgi:hypothetical protein